MYNHVTGENSLRKSMLNKRANSNPTNILKTTLVIFVSNIMAVITEIDIKTKLNVFSKGIIRCKKRNANTLYSKNNTFPIITRVLLNFIDINTITIFM